MKARVLGCVLLLHGTLSATPIAAQTLRAQCSAGSGAAVVAYCERVTEGAAILPARIGLAATGGNPVPGTASTVGMRLPGRPRIDLALRATTAAVAAPAAERQSSTRDISHQAVSAAAHASVGIFSGVTIAPTVGGFGALDLLGSVGVVPARGRHVKMGSPLTWAAGARLGVLRESFTAPGISVSAMYRGLPDVAYGDPALSRTDAYYRVRELSALSLRGVVGKRVLGLGFSAGAGWDRYAGEIDVRVSDPLITGPVTVAGQITARDGDFDTSRMAAFGNVSFTRLILHVVGELGWQQGGDAAPGQTKLDNGAWFGGLAVRLAL